MSDLRRAVPWLMGGLRMALGPVLIVGEARGWGGLVQGSVYLMAVLSDVFDGILARRWHCDTSDGALFDSMADTVFYFAVAIALWVGQPAVWREHGGWLAVLLGLEVCRFVVDFRKFGRPASYHSYLAKSWGLVLAAAVITLFAAGHATALLPIALGLGILCDVEGLTMSLVLPVWQRDVRTIRTAVRLRRELLAELAAVAGAVN